MKRYAASLLLAFFLLTTFVPPAGWQALGQLTVLKTHFEEHQKENHNLTFLDFLILHYGSDFKKHQSEHDHSKLPLKHSTPSVCATILSLPPVEIWFFNPHFQRIVVEKCSSNFDYHPIFVSLHLSNIWQPPRA